LGGTNVILAPGLEVLVRPYPNYRKPILNCIETVRGAASAMLDRGADRVYLFNYMDSETAQSDMENYSRLLREVGQLATMAGKPRRHVLTYSDTWAPGEPVGRNGLPAEAAPGRWHEFRLAVGPKPLPGPASVVLGVEKATPDELRRWALRINGHLTEFAGETKPALAVPKDCPLYAWRVSEGAVHRGYNVVEIRTESKGTIHWVEISIGA
jgi:hypothetical protein